MASDSESGDLGHLDPVIDKVEFKLTVLPGDEPKVQALLADARHIVLRSRVIQGDDDSTVKLRPAELSGDEAGWRRLDGTRAELDMVGSEQVVSAKVDGGPDPGEIEDVEADRRPVASLFKPRQEAPEDAQAAFHGLLADHAIDATGDQVPKTPRVLRFFADRR